jgi:cyclase
MHPRRLIARLDIKGPNVVKGIHLEGLRVVGDPGDLAARYYEQGIDEILYIDIVASLYGRNNILSIVQRAAENIFVPLTVGGGLRSIDDIVAALHHGADKVAINTAAIARPNLIREAAETFGRQCIVVSVEAKKRAAGRWEAFTENGREATGVDVLDWVSEAERLGAGELLITSVDREGTKKGFDLDLLREVRKRVDIPVIASGGAGTAEHIVAAVAEADIDAVACASVLHYGQFTVMDLKREVRAGGMEVRP